MMSKEFKAKWGIVLVLCTAMAVTILLSGIF